MKICTFLILATFSCYSIGAEVSVSNETVGVKEISTPQLWTGHKELAGNIETCVFKTEAILNTSGFSNITKSVHKTETYIYADFANNRAGIHCTSVGGKTFVYGSVAGADAKTVEALRNSIFWKF